VKNGWATKLLGDVCEIKPSKREARERLSAEALVSFLPMEDLGINEKLARGTQERSLSAVQGSYTYFADGDVLLAKITPCFENGKLGIAEALTNGVGFGSSEFIVFRPDYSISKEWLYYYLSRESFRVEGAARMSGAVGHKRVSMEFIEGCSIPVPSVFEQRRLVGILDGALAGLAIAAANAEKNLRNARELFDSHLKLICTQNEAGWVQTNLGAICDLFQGLAINRGTKHLLVKNSSFPLLRIKDLREGTEEQYVAETGFPKNAKVTPEDVIYTRTGQVGLVFRGRYGVLHNNCFKVTPRSGVLSGYLFWWLQNPHFRRQIIALASKAAQPDISHTIFKAQQIFVPPLNYQSDAILKIEASHAETQRLEALYQEKLSAIAELKQSILRKAFSGELSSTAISEAAE
jgi:type I restriction enzyme, S subunit